MKTENTKTAEMTAISGFFGRKIGNTTYRVSVSFSKKSNETVDDKLLRLVASESISKETGGLLCS